MPTVLYLGQLATRAQKQLNSSLTVVHPHSLKTKKSMLELISLIVFKVSTPAPPQPGGIISFSRICYPVIGNKIYPHKFTPDISAGFMEQTMSTVGEKKDVP